MEKSSALAAVALMMSGCSFLLVGGPSSGWEDTQDLDRLRSIAAVRPCTTSKVPPITDGVLGAMYGGVAFMMFFYPDAFERDPDQTRGEDLFAVGFLAGMAAPKIWSALSGNKKVNECRALRDKLTEALRRER